MMNLLQTFSQYFILIGLAGFCIIFAFVYRNSQNAKRAQRKVLGKETSYNLSLKFNKAAQSSYITFARLPILRRFVGHVRKRIETLSVYEEYALRREVMKIVFAVISFAAIIIIVLIAVRPTLIVAFWVLVGLLFISGAVVDFFVYRVEARLLTQLKQFNNRVRFYFQQLKIVDDSIFEAISHVGPEMKIQAEKIHDILTSNDPEKELEIYDEVAPSRFLKVIAGLSLLVQDQGDKVTDKGSAYLRGLSAINEELNNEILYRSKLSYKLRSLSTLALIPIFLALPIKNWGIQTFPIMQNFYLSRMGFLAEVTIYLGAVGCYLIIRKLRESAETKYQDSRKNRFWEQKLFEKVPVIEKICLAFTPKPYTKRFFKMSQLIKDANSPNKLEWITLHQIIIGVSVFILLIGGFLFAHKRELDSTMNSTLPETLFAGEISENERLAYQEMTDFDREVVMKMKDKELSPSRDDVQAYVAKMMNRDVGDPSVIYAVDRIAEKWKVASNAFFKWWEFIIVILLTVGAAYIPVLQLRVKKLLRMKDMESEVHQQLVLISSLREFDSMSVQIILSWMERFAVIFKEPIQIALLDYDSGPDEALERLTNDINFEPFQQIVERLKLALVRISISEAFDDIDTERMFYLAQRKENQERTIESKSLYGNMLGIIPVLLLVFLYLVIPLIYISMMESGKLISTIM